MLDLIICAADPDVTIGEAWMFGLMPGSNPLYDVPVYSAFVTQVEVSGNIPPQWMPSINLAPGFGTLCRDSAPYPDSQSAYHSSAGWNISGGEPYDPDGGTWNMWYYISRSPERSNRVAVRMDPEPGYKLHRSGLDGLPVPRAG